MRSAIRNMFMRFAVSKAVHDVGDPGNSMDARDPEQIRAAGEPKHVRAVIESKLAHPDPPTGHVSLLPALISAWQC
jgi:hypothetical protein